MKKPDEATLIAYLYGELEAKAQAEVEAYLKRDPELAAELAEMGEVRSFVRDHPQPERPLPPLQIELPPRARTTWWRSRWLQAAAVALLLLLSAAALDLRIEAGAGRMTLAFGEQPVPTPEPSPQPAVDLAPLLQQLAVRQDSLQQALAQVEARDTQQWQQLARQVKANQSQSVSLTPQQLQTLRAQLVAENTYLMRDLMQQAQDEQLALTADLMNQLVQHLETQRTDDLQLLATALRDVWLHQDEQHQETEILLTQLIEQVAYGAP